MLLVAFRAPSAFLSQTSFYYGVLTLLFGVMLVVRPAFFVAWIFIIAGIGIALSGINSLRLALAMRGTTNTGYSIAPVAASVLTIIMGFLVVISPFTFAGFAVSVAGFALVFCGAIKLAEALTMRAA